MRTSHRSCFWPVTQDRLTSHDSDKDETQQDDTQWTNSTES